jgi:hypothetical protein
MKGFRILLPLSFAALITVPLAAQDGTQVTPDLSRTPPKDAPAVAFDEANAAQWSNVYIRYSGPYAGKAETTGRVAGTGGLPLPKFTPEFLPRFQRNEARRKSGHEVSDQALRCAPPGMPTMLSLGYPGEFIFRKGIVNLIYEYTGVRRVFTDGRKFPDYIEPSYRGYSIGRWEGNALLIETRGIHANNTLNNVGAVHSDVMTVFEKWTSGGPGIIVNQVRVEDAKAFLEPVGFTAVYRISPDEAVNEYYCENSKEGKDGIG